MEGGSEMGYASDSRREGRADINYDDGNSDREGLGQERQEGGDNGEYEVEDDDSEESAAEKINWDAESSSAGDGSSHDESDDSPTDIEEPGQASPASPNSRAEAENIEQIVLEEVVDENGVHVYIEHYPVKSAGEPIRRATPEEMNQGNYPDVGALAKPDFFEVVQVLMESGISGNFRNKYLRLKRVSATRLHGCFC